jgi:hypothetical protein
VTRKKKIEWTTTQMAVCDNPECENLAHPENQSPYLPPYGWIAITQGQIVGYNDLSGIQVCSFECLEPAVRRSVECQHEEDFPT